MLNTIQIQSVTNTYVTFKFFVIKDRYYIKKSNSDDEKITTCCISKSSFISILKQENDDECLEMTLESTDTLYWKVFFNDTTGVFDEFIEGLNEYFNFCEDINKEQNEKTFNQILIKNTKNNINKTFPTELIDMIISFF